MEDRNNVLDELWRKFKQDSERFATTHRSEGLVVRAGNKYLDALVAQIREDLRKKEGLA